MFPTVPELTTTEPKEQVRLDTQPYDRWESVLGAVSAEFHRTDRGILVRFPRIADFVIARDLTTVRCSPAPGADMTVVDNLYYNNVLPLVGNHSGRLNLHGSAVVVHDQALAFIGLSRSGKTTLAGAFAQAGHAFLTEDVITLQPDEGAYNIEPKRALLRLFPDSAQQLGIAGADCEAGMVKRQFEATGSLPHATRSAPLGRLYFLGDGSSPDLQVWQLSKPEALSIALRHSFILDVEDAARLRAHFGRISDLVDAVPCYALDYPRRYDLLAGIVDTLAAQSGDLADK